MRTRVSRVVLTMSLFCGAQAVTPVTAQDATSITQAGGALFQGAPVYLGVRLSSVSFGMGGAVRANGSGFGHFSFRFLGVAVAGGQPREIAYDGALDAGAVSPSGVVSVSGSGTVDPGDGSPPSTSVPFVLDVTSNTEGQGTLVLVVQGAHLQAAVVNEGGVTSSSCKPPELGPSLRFQNVQDLSWSAAPGPATYRVYRGTLAGGAWAFNHACYAPNLAATSASDTTIPPVGQGLYYLVSVKNVCGEGSLGVTTSGPQVPNALPCP